ncbi:MAG TPA: flagellar export chaperone FliS [Rectinemataceae bacterium]|nr:flagellar export chaperone FliS [Rectinemataceae bacterium]
MNSNPLAAYREVRVKTASPAQIVVMLYEEAVKQCDRALDLMSGDQARNPRNIEKINAALGKTQDIVTELMAGLDFDAGGEIAQDLFALYVWFNRELMEANVEKSEKRVRAVRDQLDSLRGAWAEAATKAQNGSQGQMGVNIAG